MGKPWANEPYPLIATPTATGVKVEVLDSPDMKVLTYSIGVGRIYTCLNRNATGMSRSEDVGAFLFYCQAWCIIIHEHHHGEEETFFPMIADYTAKKDIMNTNIEQHKAFESGIQKFEKYVTETPSNAYSGSMLRKLVDDFAPALVQHLHAEISTLLSVGEKFGGEKLQKVYDEWEEKIKKESREKSDPYIMLPAGFGAVDREFEGGKHRNWPEFPWFVPYLNRFIFYRTHANAWQFSPCLNFKRRELSFVADDWQDTKAFAMNWEMVKVDGNANRK